MMKKEEEEEEEKKKKKKKKKKKNYGHLLSASSRDLRFNIEDRFIILLEKLKRG